jgi:hypothetical protein
MKRRPSTGESASSMAAFARAPSASSFASRSGVSSPALNAVVQTATTSPLK